MNSRALFLGCWACAGAAHAQLPASKELDVKANYIFRMAALPEVLTQIRKETNCELRPDPRLLNRRVTAFVTDQTRRDFLVRLARALDCEWVTSDGTTHLRPNPEIEKKERQANWAVQAKNNQELLGRIQTLVREAKRPRALIIQEFENSLNEQRRLTEVKPEGWSDVYQKLNQRLDEVLRPFAMRISLQDALNQSPNLSSSDWQAILNGRRMMWFIPRSNLPGQQYVGFFGDPTRGRLYYLDEFGTVPIASADDIELPDQDELPDVSAKHSSRFTGKDELWNDPGTPGDVDVLERFHRFFQFDCVMEGVRSTEMYALLRGTLVSKSFEVLSEKRKTDLHIDGDWLVYKSPSTPWHRQADPDEKRFKKLELGSVFDLHSLVDFASSLRGSSIAADPQQIRAEINWQVLAQNLPLCDFLASLTPAQFGMITSGRAIGFSELSSWARQMADVLLMKGPGAQPWLTQTKGKEEELYFYFERYGRPMWQSTNGQGKSVIGGVNDGAEKVFPNDENVSRTTFYRYELNFYFGYEFARSVRHQIVLDSKIQPPIPKNDPNAAPPEHHEGHGPS